MELELLNDKNIDIAIKIQKELFPLENGSGDLRDSVHDACPPYLFLKKYWLAQENGRYVGICGLYAYKFAPKDAWLGWYGVVEKERNKGFGKLILRDIMNVAKDMGFETFRLYTDEIDNATAVKLYEKVGMIREIYDNPEDVHFQIGDTLIFSTSLVNKKITLWNNKNLYLKAHDDENI